MVFDHVKSIIDGTGRQALNASQCQLLAQLNTHFQGDMDSSPSQPSRAGTSRKRRRVEAANDSGNRTKGKPTKNLVKNMTIPNEVKQLVLKKQIPTKFYSDMSLGRLEPVGVRIARSHLWLPGLPSE